MRHQAQKGFRGIFVRIPQHKKGYLVCLPSTMNIIYQYYVVLYETFRVRYHIHHNLIQKQWICVRL